MKISEIINTPRFTLTEAGMAHAEDLVFTEGSSGALRVIQSIASLPKKKDELLSIKWDGSVRLVAGRDEEGNFIMTDGAGWTAKGYNGLYKSPKEFIEQKRSKGTNEDYLKSIVELWPIMKSAFPAGYRGFVNGDMMWFPGSGPKGLTENTKRYIFTPNTVTYEIDKNSDLGKRIGQSEAGFAVHGYFPTTNDKTPTPIRDTAGLNINGRMCILGPEIKNEASVQIDKTQIKQATQFVKQRANIIDPFLNPENLSALKLTDLPKLLITFVTAYTKSRDLSLLADKFLPWVQSNPKISAKKIANLTEYSKSNPGALTALFDIVDLLIKLKLDVLHQLDSHEGTVIAHIKGARGGEGYVHSDPGGPIKYIDRLHFSAANFAGHDE